MNQTTAPTLDDPAVRLTSGRLLARNSLWNLAGQILPLLVAVVSIPVLVRGLGTDRFGILLIAWAVIGYFGIFDFGISRALTQLVARRLGGGDAEIGPLVGTGLLLLLGLGLVGGTCVAATSGWMVHRLLRVPVYLQAETFSALLLLGLALPAVIVAAGLRGVLEAHQRFGVSNAIRIPLGALTYLGPILVLPFTHSLVAVLGVLIAIRYLVIGAYVWWCMGLVGGPRRLISFDAASALPLIRFGGWMTVSNLISPLMSYMDRFVVGAFLSVTAVAYYATPYDLVTRLLLIPAGLAAVLFPAFAATVQGGSDRAALLFSRGLKYTFIALFPAVLLVVAFAKEGLGVWLGLTFAGHSTHVLQLLAIGVLINSVAQIAFALVQGLGRADLTAKLHLLEVPVYTVMLLALVVSKGIDGAAAAWLLRVAVDMLLLLVISGRLLSKAIPATRVMGLVILVGTLLLLVPVLGLPLPLRAVYAGLLLSGFAVVVWLRLLTPAERDFGRRSLVMLAAARRPAQ